jgi:cytochrome c biogenesis protein CcmG, thiol:disulfide interchange protein DsbE
VLLAAGVGVLLASSHALATAPPAAGQLAPPLAGTGFSGVAFDLSTLRGSVVVLNFWASWCEPCRDLRPVLDLLAHVHQADGLLVYGVSVDEDRAQWEASLAASPVGYQQLWDKGGARHAERLAIERLPTTLLIDRAGLVRFVHQGFQPADADQLAAQVKALLAEAR